MILYLGKLNSFFSKNYKIKKLNKIFTENIIYILINKKKLIYRLINKKP